MAVMEALTLGRGAALVKALGKIWLKDQPLLEAAAGATSAVVFKRIADFQARRATEKLFSNLQDEIAARLAKVIDVEFATLPKATANPPSRASREYSSGCR